jgi:hypothetical protein
MTNTILFQIPGITIASDPVAHTMAPYFGMVRPDGSGINYGFVDLRGRPELVDEISEVQEYPCLRSLLVVLSQNGSPFMSIGCDRGPVRQSGRSDGWSFAHSVYDRRL